jgi:hypothetical protein
VTLHFRRLGEAGRALPAIQARWSSAPEPVRRQPIGSGTGPVRSIDEWSRGLSFVDVYDPALSAASLRQDISAGEDGEEIAVAILKEDGSAYAWGAESYRFEGWANPAWKLEDQTEYEVTIRVEGSGVGLERRFRLPFLSDDFAEFTVTPVR